LNSDPLQPPAKRANQDSFDLFLNNAYRAFEDRVAAADTQGNKQQRVREYVLAQAPREFRRRDIERALPDISDATVRLVLNELRLEGLIEAEGPGRGARWRRLRSATSTG
jgi:hypothetical protein